MIAWTLMLYVVARAEVLLRSSSLRKAMPASPDELPAAALCSVRRGDTSDRRIAEVDQQGYIFALDPVDQPQFHTSSVKEPRRHSEILVILREGRVCVRKSLLPPLAATFRARFLHALGWSFYLEAAALLRLRGLDGVPKLLRVDTRARALEMEYIRGSDIRQEIIGSTGAHSCASVDRIFRQRLRAKDDNLGDPVRDLLRSVMRRGVVPTDIHAANFIRGKETGRLYLVDYQLLYFRHIPGWRDREQELNKWLT